ncbi:MAG: polyphenol oxidase family protein [Solirubrobacteraceae bacterium]|nr:polyphenol oxidase family protein [Solirubrobacteraceae bacterium]
MSDLAALLADPFVVRDRRIAIDLPGGQACFTTARDGSLAPGDPDAARVAERLAQAIGIPVERWAQDNQVHGAHVRVAATAEALRPMSADADGQATALREVACVVRVADCLPIALIAPEGVAALHGGWRSLAAGIVDVGVAALHRLGASEIRAAIGPGAGVCCYQAGAEVHAALAPLGAGVRRGDHADLLAAARALLVRAGVDEIHAAGICTICADPELLYSHRRDHGATGRQALIAWRS